MWVDHTLLAPNTWDDGPGRGNFWDKLPVAVDNKDNYPLDNPTHNLQPKKPTKLLGPRQGEAGKKYTYKYISCDIESDQIYYLFDWGDGTNTGWIGPYNSGEACEASHVWQEKGNYSIRVKAKDEHGAESVWSNPKDISMPKSKNIEIPKNKFDTSSGMICITKPVDGAIYLFNNKIMDRFFRDTTICIGGINIKVSITSPWKCDRITFDFSDGDSGYADEPWPSSETTYSYFYCPLKSGEITVVAQQWYNGEPIYGDATTFKIYSLGFLF
jgi:hypothetical protein